MSSYKDLNALARRERLRAMRTWCFGLGIAACAIAVLPPNTSLVGNPEAWGPTGGIRFFVVPFLTAPVHFSGWFAISMLISGVALLLAGVALAIFLRRDPRQ
jgi:hypothetical protein